VRWVVLGALLGLLLSVFLAFCAPVAERGMQIRALAQARSTALTLRLYAGDHDERYPVFSVVAPDGTYAGVFDVEATDANAAFRVLIPDYAPDERLFWVPGSPWTPRAPDEKLGPGRTLGPGENHWAYVPGLSMYGRPDFPLLADGFALGRPGVYDTESLCREGWKNGRTDRVVVVRTDMSGALEKLVRQGDVWIVPRRPIPGESVSAVPQNLFSVSTSGAPWIPRPPVNPLPPPGGR
jgi:hypothetical protein